jgi:phosphate transport system protein
MFRELFTALRAEDPMDQAFDELGQMLEHGQWMFREAVRVVDQQETPDESRDAIYARDKKINDLLRSIRRKIVRHLTINPGYDVTAGLTLISVAKDAERVGDYCKNLFDVGRIHDRPFSIARYNDPLVELRDDVASLFDHVRRAFAKSSTSKAREAISAAEAIGHRCDDIVEHLLRDETTVVASEAAAYALLARHTKRIASHLSNICTAMVSDVEDLDFSA